MQIQRPNDKVTSLLIAESDNWPFSPSMQGKKSIHLVQVDGPLQQYCLILISLLFGLHTCNCQENKTGAPKAPCLWALFTSALDEIPCTTSPNLKTIFYFSPSQKPHHDYGRTYTWDLFPVVIKPESRLETKKVCEKATDFHEEQ